MNRSTPLAAAAALLLFAPLGSRAAEQEVTFRGEKVWYEGAELKWIGDPTASDAELILIYTNTAAATRTLRASQNVQGRVLLVGGGGAGGTVRSSGYTSHPGGGGGGAGEVLDRNGVPFNKGETYAFTIGLGGVTQGSSIEASAGGNGGDSFIAEGEDENYLRVKGGGGGGAEGVGQPGGSGGGGSNENAAGGESVKLNEDGLGTAGGSSLKRYAGGGGGAGAAGHDATDGAGGDGGDGVVIDITGEDVTYGGGGGGGTTYSGKSSGTGGAGGGGAGGKYNDSAAAAPKPGTDGLGGGGGGGGRYRIGAPGGSGAIIVRLNYVDKPITWVEIPVTVGGNQGTIYIDDHAKYEWKGSDLVISYTDVDNNGALRVGDAEMPVWAQARVLAVGGGGGGGLIGNLQYGGGAGGGAGGFVERSGIVFDNTTTNSIVVGRGGKGGSTHEESGEDGKSSVIKANGVDLIDEAVGGGGGGAHARGGDGGSGGGGSQAATLEKGDYNRDGGTGVDGQGYAGGAGKAGVVGGGGGGAGGVGTNGTAFIAGAGGAGAGGIGRASDITGSEVWYAGGGGGAYVNPNNTTTTKHLGGAGGQGGGGAGAGVDGGTSGKDFNPIAAKDGVDGLGGGGGGGTSHEGGTSPAGKGGNGIVIIRLSGFVVKGVPEPEETDPDCTYDGVGHLGFKEFYAYEFSGDQVATNADVYALTATLKYPDMVWATDGSCEPRPLTWMIRQRPVDVPTVNDNPPREGYFTFGNAARNDEEEKIAIDTNLWRLATRDQSIYPGETCAITNGLGMELVYCTLTGHCATNAGPYSYVAKLVEVDPQGNSATNFVWEAGGAAGASGGTMRPADVTWEIRQAENAITALSIDDWQEGKPEGLPGPSATWQWQEVTAKYPTPDVVKYRWRPQGKAWDAEPRVWGEVVPPTAAGVYELEASVVKDSNHTPGNWAEAKRIFRFCIWRHPSKMLADYVDITVEGYAGGATELRDFPVLVRLREAVRDGFGGITAGIPGFRPADVNKKGAELRFVSAADYAARDDERDLYGDQLLPFEVDTWNPSGESLVWVRLPKLSGKDTKLRMYWRVRDGKTLLVDKLASETWSAYAGVWHMNGGFADSTAAGRDAQATSDAAYDFVIGSSGSGQAVNMSAGSVLADNPFTNATDKAALRTYSLTAQTKAEVKTNDVTLTLAAKGQAIDEVRLLKAVPLAAWDTAENDTLHKTGFCTFDLVNRLEAEAGEEEPEVRAWVTYWKPGCGPWAAAAASGLGTENGRYWVEGVLKPELVESRKFLGELKIGSPTATYTAMPARTPVDFPVEKGGYEIRVSLLDPNEPTPGYPGPKTLFDGVRKIDIEIVEKIEPSPIDPHGLGPDEVNRRILLGNDDTNGKEPVTGQSYWTWTHEIELPVDGYPNLRPSTLNTFKASDGEVLWQLSDVHLGNIMDADATTKPFAAANWHTLPWALTSRNMFEEDYGKELFPTQVCNLVMRNLAGSLADDLGAQIVSPVYTNGIGTVYFDAVNAFSTSDTNAYKLVVEVTTETDAEPSEASWERCRAIAYEYTGAAFAAKPVTNETVTLKVNANDATGKGRFYRVIVLVDRREKLRFRIRRVGAIAGEQDNAKGFIVLDNVIASWPTVDVSLKSYGWYDIAKRGRQVLGMEGAFSVPFPAVGVSDLYVSGWLEEGLDPSLVASARLHYRWRSLNAAFDPPREYVNGVLSDIYDVIYLDPAGGYRTIEPLAVTNGLPGDIEYWFDLTAAVPYYGYVDHSGLEAGTGTYTEERARGVPSRRKEREPQPSPSCGEDWFVRLREGASDYESIRVFVRPVPLAGEVAGEETVIDLELIGNHCWRGFYPTKEPPKSHLVEYRIEAFRPDGAIWSGDDLICEYRTGDDDLATATKVPGTVGVVEDLPNAYRKVWCDAATGALMFRLNDTGATMSMEVARADSQTFEAWSSSWRDGPDFRYYTSASETNSVSDLKTRYPAAGEPSPTDGFEKTEAVKAEWREDFRISSAQSAAGYPLKKPFTSALTPNGRWTAGQGMWVSQAYGLTNLTDFAVQLQGRGNGSLLFEDPTGKLSPDGLDTVSFTTRLAQYIDFDDISYCMTGFMMTNYTVMAQAAFDPSPEFAGFSGEGSVSLIAGYFPGKGCYEYRVTMVNADPDLNEGKGLCRHELYRWTVDGMKMKPELLYSVEDGAAVDRSGTMYEWTWEGDSKRGMAYAMPLGVNDVYQTPHGRTVAYSGLFLSYGVDRNGWVSLVGGVSPNHDRYTKGVVGKQPLDPDFEYSDAPFKTIEFVDRDAKKITRGTYGALANDCPAQLYHLRTYTNSLSAAYSAGACSSRFISFTNSVGKAFSEKSNIDNGLWALRPGRMRMIPQSKSGGWWGLMAETNLVQTVTVESRKSAVSGAAWTNIDTVVVNSFASRENPIALHTRDKCDVRFGMGGTADDERTDVVIDSLALSQWCGTDGTMTNQPSSTTKYFYYTGAWIAEHITRTGWNIEKREWTYATNLWCKLAPRRAKEAAKPVSLVSPHLSGFGSISFTYRNATPDAKLLLQICECPYNEVPNRRQDASDSSLWKTLEEISFGDRTDGTLTRHLGRRYRADGTNVGLIRLVVPREIVVTALAEDGRGKGGDWADWASIEISDIYVYDEPGFDNRSWWGWNFLTTGWSTNGVATAEANLYDGPGGGVGALNDTLDESTLVDPDRTKYEPYDPFIQTPTFTNQYVGEISFRARVFDPGQLESTPPRPSCVTVWGAADGISQDPDDWIALTNIIVDTRAYRLHTVKCGDDRRFASVRIGVTAVEGITEPMDPARAAPLPDTGPQCVLIDDFVVSERGKPEISFRLDHVRPFRLGLTSAAVVDPDIASRDQQPLLNEEFGFQAEIDMTSPSSEIDFSRTPEVILSYYPSDEPWGYDRWCGLPGAVTNVPLARAEGTTDLVYRSTDADSRGFVRPQTQLTNQVYGLVQYHLQIRYWDVGGGVHLAPITADDWRMPSWYEGFPDPNESHGTFSPFTLLDLVSPGRAWINEVNFSNAGGATEPRKYIEICVPAGFDMTGWQLYGYDVWGKDPGLMAVLGYGTVTNRKDTANKVEGFDFLTIQSPKGKVEEVDDGFWANTSNDLTPDNSYGFELIRPSGVIEERIVIQGNIGTGRYSQNKLGTNMVVELGRLLPGKAWTFVASDTNATGKSASVVESIGERMSEWVDDVVETPGRLNVGQTIPPGWFLPPTGTNVWIMLTALDRHISILDGTNEVDALTVVVPIGTETNIVFRAAPWYQLGKLVRNATQDVTAATFRTGRDWRYTAVENSSNRLSLEVSSAIGEDVLRDGALDPRDPYAPAVMRWLEVGSTGLGAFEGDTIRRATMRNLAGGAITNLTLTQMYWLDIDPTSGNWEFWQGMGEVGNNWRVTPGWEPAREVIRGNEEPPLWPTVVTNRMVTTTMMITNIAARSPGYPFGGTNYPPYRLQGLANEKSDQIGSYTSWTSVTVKVKMSLVKKSGSGGQDVRFKFLPMRNFILAPGSLGAVEGHPNAARIEILDPYSRQSPGYVYGWHDYPGSDFWYKWTMDTEAIPQSPGVLKSNDTWVDNPDWSY